MSTAANKTQAEGELAAMNPDLPEEFVTPAVQLVTAGKARWDQLYIRVYRVNADTSLAVCGDRSLSDYQETEMGDRFGPGEYKSELRGRTASASGCRGSRRFRIDGTYERKQLPVIAQAGVISPAPGGASGGGLTIESLFTMLMQQQAAAAQQSHQMVLALLQDRRGGGDEWMKLIPLLRQDRSELGEVVTTLATLDKMMADRSARRTETDDDDAPAAAADDSVTDTLFKEAARAFLPRLAQLVGQPRNNPPVLGGPGQPAKKPVAPVVDGTLGPGVTGNAGAATPGQAEVISPPAAAPAPTGAEGTVTLTPAEIERYDTLVSVLCSLGRRKKDPREAAETLAVVIDQEYDEEWDNIAEMEPDALVTVIEAAVSGSGLPPIDGKWAWEVASALIEIANEDGDDEAGDGLKLTPPEGGS